MLVVFKADRSLLPPANSGQIAPAWFPQARLRLGHDRVLAVKGWVRVDVARRVPGSVYGLERKCERKRVRSNEHAAAE